MPCQNKDDQDDEDDQEDQDENANTNIASNLINVMMSSMKLFSIKSMSNCQQQKPLFIMLKLVDTSLMIIKHLLEFDI